MQRSQYPNISFLFSLEDLREEPASGIGLMFAQPCLSWYFPEKVRGGEHGLGVGALRKV